MHNNILEIKYERVHLIEVNEVYKALGIKQALESSRKDSEAGRAKNHNSVIFIDQYETVEAKISYGKTLEGYKTFKIWFNGKFVIISKHLYQ